MSNERANLGLAGESLATEYLSHKSYSILHRNFRSRSGEIDIIAKDGKTLVFIEVKTRRTAKFGSPAAAVTARKQAQISRVALEYLAIKNLFDVPARFDVVTILMPRGREPIIDIITNAFDLQHSG